MTDRPKSTTCPRCGRTSYNSEDITHHYCGACHLFYDDPEPEESRR